MKQIKIWDEQKILETEARNLTYNSFASNTYIMHVTFEYMGTWVR